MGFKDIPGQPRVVMRGDVEDGLFTCLPGDVEIRFSTVPAAIKQDNPGLLFSYRVDAVGPEFARRPIESLRKAYGPEPAGPLLGRLLDEFEAAPESLFDTARRSACRGGTGAASSWSATPRGA